MRSRLALALLAASLALSSAGGRALAQPQAVWPDAFLSRVEILALIQTLNASLLASRSATATLERWCADHGMAAAPRVIARRLAGVETPASEETRQRLGVAPSEPVKHRRVELSCGGHVLSEADNWYVPGRLPAEANRLLDATETPFGKAVAALQPFRRTIDMKMRWSPLAEGWELRREEAKAPKDGGALDIPRELFEHRAILYAGDRQPLAELHETYRRDILDFEPRPVRPPAAR